MPVKDVPPPILPVQVSGEVLCEVADIRCYTALSVIVGTGVTTGSVRRMDHKSDAALLAGHRPWLMLWRVLLILYLLYRLNRQAIVALWPQGRGTIGLFLLRPC